MPAGHVTPLAEHRLLRDEHPIVVRPVRIVAAGAVLASGRVLPQEGTALLGVATGTALVDGVANLEHADVGGPMRVVAAGTVHLSFAHRHVTRPFDLHRFL